MSFWNNLKKNIQSIPVPTLKPSTLKTEWPVVNQSFPKIQNTTVNQSFPSGQGLDKVSKPSTSFWDGVSQSLTKIGIPKPPEPLKKPDTNIQIIQPTFGDLAQAPSYLLGKGLIEPGYKMASSVYELATDKKAPELNIPVIGNTKFFGDGGFTKASSYQKQYRDAIDSGISEKDAYKDILLGGIMDAVMLAGPIKGGVKTSLKKFAPETLVKKDITQVSKQQLFDYLSGKKSPTELGLSDDVVLKISEKMKTMTTQEKAQFIQGFDLLKAKPSILGRMFGVSEQEAKNMLNAYGGEVRTSASGSLPGYQMNPEAGAINPKGTPVGFGQEPKPHLKFDTYGNKLPYTAREKAIVNQPQIPKKAKVTPILLKEELEPPKGILNLTKQKLSPLKFVGEDTANVFRKWNSDNIIGKELANQRYQTTRILDDNIDTIYKYQSDGKNTEIKKLFDDLYNKANTELKQYGSEIPYRQNYIPQVYRENPKQIQDAIVKYLKKNAVNDEQAMDYVKGLSPLPDDVAKRLKLSPNFEKERVFANYKVAEEYGLHPKFKTVAEHAAYYDNELSRIVANQKLLENLKSKGLLREAGIAPKEWEIVNPEFSGMGLYKAPPNVAEIINNIFPKSKKTLYGSIVKPIGELSGIAQNLALSGGIPGANVNFFTLGQLNKEILTGNVKAANSFLKTNSSSATAKYFNEHSKTLFDMADEGIDITLRNGAFKQENIKSLVQDKDFVKALGFGIDKVFGEKTFQGFMPMMQVNLFEDVYKSAIKKGLPIEEAKKLAGNIVKKNFGISSDDFVRSQSTKDTLKAVFFAPRFRQTIINSLSNTGKAGFDFIKQLGGLRGKLDPSLSRNRRLLSGMILSYGLYNYFNKKNTGHYMWENPENRMFSLAIPRENGEIMYLEFMPSYLAFARNMVQGGISAGTGDFKGATQKFGSVFSMPLKIGTELYSNSDYFGNKIYDDNDSFAVKMKKMALYTGLQVSHPYIKEIVNQVQAEEKKPLYQSMIVAMELPLKFSTQEKEEINRIFDIRDEQIKANKKLSEEAQKTHEELKQLPKEEANKLASEIKKTNPKLYDKIKTIVDSEKSGLSKTETYIKLLSPEYRARYIYDQAEKLQTNEEKNSYLSDLKKKKVITDDTWDELKKIIKTGQQ